MFQNGWQVFSFLVVSTLTVAVIASPAYTTEQQDIVDTAKSMDSFQTFCKALEVADLIETLQGEGPFTVFAPSDEAFAKFPTRELNELFNDKPRLKTFLLYHIVPGQVMASEAMELGQAKTATGKPLQFNTTDSGVMINDARITQTDIRCTNGVIHVIDTVLTPEQ